MAILTGKDITSFLHSRGFDNIVANNVHRNIDLDEAARLLNQNYRQQTQGGEDDLLFPNWSAILIRQYIADRKANGVDLGGRVILDDGETPVVGVAHPVAPQTSRDGSTVTITSPVLNPGALGTTTLHVYLGNKRAPVVTQQRDLTDPAQRSFPLSPAWNFPDTNVYLAYEDENGSVSLFGQIE